MYYGELWGKFSGLIELKVLIIPARGDKSGNRVTGKECEGKCTHSCANSDHCLAYLYSDQPKLYGAKAFGTSHVRIDSGVGLYPDERIPQLCQWLRPRAGVLTPLA